MKSLFIDVLHARRPELNYVTPAICEVVFSGTSASDFPTIVLEPLATKRSPGGFIVTYYGDDGNFTLTWDQYPGALCYSVYKLIDPIDPYSGYQIINECITDNHWDPNDPPEDPDPDVPPPVPFVFDPNQNYCFVVTAVTPLGETVVSDTVCTGPGHGGGSAPSCPVITAQAGTLLFSYTAGDNFTVGPVMVQEGSGPVKYEWWKDGVFYIDTTSTTKGQLNVTIADAEDAGSYVLKVVNSTIPCTATATAIVVNECPRILAESPSPVPANEGDDVILTVDVHPGTGPVTYVWYKNSTLFADTTNSTQGSLELDNISAGTFATYSLRVTNTTHGCFVDSQDIVLEEAVLTCADWSTLSPLAHAPGSPFTGGVTASGFTGTGAIQGAWSQVTGIGACIVTANASLSTNSTGTCNYSLNSVINLTGANGMAQVSIFVDEAFANGCSAYSDNTQDLAFSVPSGPHDVRIEVVTDASTNTKVELTFTLTTV